VRYKAGTGTIHDENNQGPTDSTVENANSETKSSGQRVLSTLRKSQVRDKPRLHQKGICVCA
jgi:hypothetical protein